MLSQAKNKVDDLKRELANAEAAYTEAVRAQERRCRQRPCPSCGRMVNVNTLPTKEGPQGNVNNPSIECEGCNRVYDISVRWNGGDKLVPSNYQAEFTHRGYSWDTVPVSKLSNDMLQASKEFIAQLGEAAVPAQRDRLAMLLHEQTLRADARKLDVLVEQNKSILELLKDKFSKGD